MPSTESPLQPSSPSVNNNSAKPCSAVAPETIFGWSALLSAVQSVLQSVPLLRALPLARNTPSPSADMSVPLQEALLSSDVTMTPLTPSPPVDKDPSQSILVSPLHTKGGASSSQDVSKASPNASTHHASPSIEAQPRLALTELPDELIAMCYADLPATDLVALELVSRRLRHLIAYDSLCWKRCTESRWGHLSCNSVLLPAAARHANTWKNLYSEKAVCDAKHTPWLTLCKSETSAILDLIKGEDTAPQKVQSWPINIDNPIPASPPKDSVLPHASASPVSVMSNSTTVNCLSVVLLIDASSSVTDDDFDAMKTFARALVDNLRASRPEAAVAVVQFNQHPKVEVSLTNVWKSKLSTSIDNMEQLMGSTDIAAPIRRAREILSEEASPGDRAIVLLTDGQTHADELEESEREARKAAEEVGARLYTLGVGRDIDEIGLGRVAAGSTGGMHFTLRRLVSSK